MKRKTKCKVSMTLDDNVYQYLNKYENKSKYIEQLIYKDIKEKDMLKKEIIL